MRSDTSGKGWYHSVGGGGWMMQDTTWIRNYNSKQLYITNNIACTANVTAYYSDMRLKDKVEDIPNALEKIGTLSGFIYTNNELAYSFGYTETKRQVGLSAQELEKVLPEVVTLAPFDFETGEEEGDVYSKSGENYLTVDYSRIVPLLVEGIKELTEENKQLKQDILDIKQHLGI